MKGKAAVVYENKGPFRVETVELDEPKAGEVLVKMVSASLCHTDIAVWDGSIPMTPKPVVLGHEGAGIVEKVGPGVTKVAVGDHVVLTYPSCGRCPACLKGKPFGCYMLMPLAFGGVMPDNTKRLRKNGQEVSSFFCQSSLAEYAVATERTVVKVAKDVPLEKLAPLGCGVITGSGAVLNKLKPEPGSRIAIFGCGGVGLSAVMAARVAGCGVIIAVDVLEKRLKLAGELGATHTLNAAKVNVVEEIQKIAGGGIDYAVECSGRPEVLRQAVDALLPLGVAAVVGAPPFGKEVKLDHLGLLLEKTVTGVVEGDSIPDLYIPRLIEFYQQGRFPFDRLSPKTYALDQINQAVEEMVEEVIKPLFLFK